MCPPTNDFTNISRMVLDGVIMAYDDDDHYHISNKKAQETEINCSRKSKYYIIQ